ncbi:MULTISPECIES: hypothetical protein [Streptomyces]|uniref:hypothetical protein n=1 Tax=Streptomyces TaxID=1883 RepID=UPI00163CF4AF|nr:MULTISPECIES: hypothetical protein [Streptomyces]MBC2879485.1 hypothetical protein [Streptomyces sp. TYQ1024]UBI35036.1 hypothetical protein K7I03_00250 [Streptomyces mobaraensis]UKW27633.1 hypothetical protein MCU78_00285 [Streptomyces sp. TYQ1024]UKW33368.1 hypothetical protein MCU78_32780 [Streptomyces sp. TYQ1024]
MPEASGKPGIHRPSKTDTARTLATSLVRWATRRPLPEQAEDARRFAHSSDARQTVTLLVVLETVTALCTSAMLPPAFRACHAAFEALLVLAGFGAVAAMARSPHLVSPSRLVLRTGCFGSLTVPGASVASVTRVTRTVTGLGVRRVPGEPRAVACSAGGAVDLCLRLDPPAALDLGKSGVTTEVDTVYISADAPRAFAQAVREAAALRH